MKVNGFRVKFVEVCEWFDGCDKLKFIFKSRKTKINKFNLDITLKLLHNKDYWKIKEFAFSFPSLSIEVDWWEREMFNSSGLEHEVCAV